MVRLQPRGVMEEKIEERRKDGLVPLPQCQQDLETSHYSFYFAKTPNNQPQWKGRVFFRGVVRVAGGGFSRQQELV